MRSDRGGITFRLSKSKKRLPILASRQLNRCQKRRLSAAHESPSLSLERGTTSVPPDFYGTGRPIRSLMNIYLEEKVLPNDNYGQGAPAS